MGKVFFKAIFAAETLTPRKVEKQKRVRPCLSDHKMKTSILLIGFQKLNLERLLGIIYSTLLVNCLPD